MANFLLLITRWKYHFSFSNWIDVLLIYIQIEEEFVIIKSEIEDKIRKHLSTNYIHMIESRINRGMIVSRRNWQNRYPYIIQSRGIPVIQKFPALNSVSICTSSKVRTRYNNDHSPFNTFTQCAAHWLNVRGICNVENSCRWEVSYTASTCTSPTIELRFRFGRNTEAGIFKGSKPVREYEE